MASFLRGRFAVCVLLLLALLLAGCWPFPAGPHPTLPARPTTTSRPTTAPSPTSTPSPLAAPTATLLASPPPTPIPPPPSIEHVLLISIDGLRPDALPLIETPHIDRLWQGGAYSWQAQTILPSATLPSHAAMLTGLPPEVTVITWNNWSKGEPYVDFITVLGLAHETGLSTAAFVGKGKLESLFPPGSVDKLVVTYGDARIAEEAAAYIVRERPALAFVHLPEVDGAGHTYGWLTQGQLRAVEGADAAVGRLLSALEEAGIAESTAIILTADHGGHGTGHGSDLPEDMTIPWIAYGPRIAAGKEFGGTIHTYDTAATVAYALGLPVPADWWGLPVYEAFAVCPSCPSPCFHAIMEPVTKALVPRQFGP